MMDHKLLRQFALQAAQNSYSPYSKFKVGAAALFGSLDGGQGVFVGANVENASYGLTICAERTAIFNGVTAGFTKLLAIAVACPSITPGMPIEYGMPCGACRQVMSEFGDDETVIFVGDQLVTKLKQLLPLAFSLKS